MMKTHYQVVIVGGGTGGIMTAAQLRRRDRHVSVAIIEPNDFHWYLPAWTLVGAGVFQFQRTRREEKKLIPQGVEWIRDRATVFTPGENKVTTQHNGDIYYDYLVISAGIKMDLDALPGLREALETSAVCSNYLDPRKTFRVLRNFRGGNAVFTQPATPIRCGGAPMKIMFLAESYFRRHGLRDKTQIYYATPGTVIFGVKEFADTLTGIVQKRNILFKPFYKPLRIDPVKQEITFEYTRPGTVFQPADLDPAVQERLDGPGLITVHYDMLHLAPPQTAPDFIRQSPFAYQEGPNKGWMEVDTHTLRSPVYPNVFGIGDAVALPTAKTGAAIRKQAPVVVDNILHLMKQLPLGEKQYEGYSSCPIVTDYGKMLLAEFKYGNVRDTDPLIKRFVDTTKEQWSMWILKKYGLPWLYWHRMLKGKM
ncbi:MAG TPA: FAD/NAD(P)-binding oxidoreductase [Chitinophagaceae bacterium]|nr:FAD/NAD(P)-binding oxidoreductase [Chitinophagaceae bacterium]